MEARTEAERATSLRRALNLILALGQDEALQSGGLGVVRLSERLGSDKSSVSRALHTLMEYGLVERDADTLAYRLGWTLFALAQRIGDARLLVLGKDHVAALAAEFDEAAHLSVRVGADVLTVISQPVRRSMSAASWVGRTIPAHCTSSGRALLLDHRPDQLRRDLAGVVFGEAGPAAPRDLVDLHERIQLAHARGYAVADEESELGLTGVAAPVRNHHGEIVAALNISAPRFRFFDRVNEAGPRVKAGADSLSIAIGWKSDLPAPPTDSRRSNA